MEVRYKIIEVAGGFQVVNGNGLDVFPDSPLYSSELVAAEELAKWLSLDDLERDGWKKSETGCRYSKGMIHMVRLSYGWQLSSDTESADGTRIGPEALLEELKRIMR